MIQRFSEDIDIFLAPLAFEPPLTKRGIDRELKSLRDAVAAHPALQFVPEESQTQGQCEILCFGSRPSWEIVQARFIELRNLL